MKFALIVDKCRVNSYTIRENRAYKFQDTTVPYQFHASIENECFMGFWGYPFLFETGYFLNWSEFDILPNLDLDLIMVAIESDYNKYTIQQLRNQYPNAIIIAAVKETWNWKQQYMQRLEVYNQCDYVFSCIDEKYFATSIPEILNCKVPIKYIPQPVNIDYLYKRFYKEQRELKIFSYWPYWNQDRVGKTEEFTKYISDKYKIPYIRPMGHDGVTKWLDYLKSWSECTFHFNLDSTESFPGQQAIQCATLGMIHLGGHNDSHKILYPETATCDFKILESRFVELLQSSEKRNSHIMCAWENVNSLYGYTSVKKQIETIYNKIKK